jgi:hypothetical protein
VERGRKGEKGGEEEKGDGRWGDGERGRKEMGDGEMGRGGERRWEMGDGERGRKEKGDGERGRKEMGDGEMGREGEGENGREFDDFLRGIEICCVKSPIGEIRKNQQPLHTFNIFFQSVICPKNVGRSET